MENRKSGGKRRERIFHPFPLAEADPPLGGNLEVRTGRPTGLLRHCTIYFVLCVVF